MFRALSLLCLLWGFNWVVMKVANEFFSPSFFAMLRFSTGAAILLMVTVIKQYAIMLALSAAMVWAAGNVAMKGKLMGCDLTSLTAWQMTIGAVVLAVYNVFIGDWYAEWNTLSIACIAYNGALASAVAFLLWCYLLDKAYGSQQGSHIFSGSSSSGYRFGNCVFGRKSDAGYGNGHVAGFCRYCPGAERLMKNKLAVLSGFMVCYWLSP